MTQQKEDYTMIEQTTFLIQQALIERFKQHASLPRLFAADESSLPITDSFINLSILTKQKLKEQEHKLNEAQQQDSRLPSYEDLYNDCEKVAIELTQLFEERDKKSAEKLLIYGRAGIGKTVLCQYLAYQWALGETELGDYLRIKFKAVFWLKLRDIATHYPIERVNYLTDDDYLYNVFNDYCFHGEPAAIPDKNGLLSFIKQYSNEILFLLDGYDEIAASNELKAINRLLKPIYRYKHVLLTSRPIPIEKVGGVSLRQFQELECMGFTDENIENFINNYFKQRQKENEAEAILNFLQTHPSIWGIAHIPINLELICWCWAAKCFDTDITTLTQLYNLLVSRLQEVFEKYPELNQSINGKKISQLAFEFMQLLAHRAMQNHHILIEGAMIRSTLNAFISPNLNGQQKLLLEACHQLGLLKTTKEGGQDSRDQTHYFIHLSFQEYCAAQYYAAHIYESSIEKEVKKTNMNLS